jgi:hypothetical protein
MPCVEGLLEACDAALLFPIPVKSTQDLAYMFLNSAAKQAFRCPATAP